MTKYRIKNPTGKGYYRLHMDCYTYDSMGKGVVKYALFEPFAKEPLFTGKDFHASPLHEPEGKHAMLSLMSFLTLQYGDTDDDYFKDYTTEQKLFAVSFECEQLKCEISEREERLNRHV